MRAFIFLSDSTFKNSTSIKHHQLPESGLSLATVAKLVGKDVILISGRLRKDRNPGDEVSRPVSRPECVLLELLSSPPPALCSSSLATMVTRLV
jgi:hypothetical protein